MTSRLFKPDKLKQGRVLAALIKGGTILVPLRSMFEQMVRRLPTTRAARPSTFRSPEPTSK